jgi:parallel beta-helix repeat protein
MLLMMLVSISSSALELHLVLGEKPAILASQTLNLSINLDVYTQRGGNGPLEPSDAFGPQEEIFLYSNLTYNLEPLQDVDIKFEVFYPNETLCFERYNVTNGDGIATIVFSMPWPCTSPEEIFGNWTVLAEAEVEETTANDTMRFEYGFLADILHLETGLDAHGDWLPKSFFCREEQIDVRVGLKKIRIVPINVTIALTVYDNLSVPILQKFFNHTIFSREENISIGMGTIPKWAIIGEGSLNAIILDREWNALCEEKSTELLIIREGVRVTVPGDYSTIQEAIWASEYWTTIVVSPGIYYEHVVLNKPVLLFAGECGRVVIDGEGLGIGFNVTSHCTKIIGFTIQNQDIGIYALNSSRNMFYHNNLINNTIQVYLENSFDNTWDNAQKGNYWSDYEGADLDNNGIGDTSYFIDENNQDIYPIMKPWVPPDMNGDHAVNFLDAIILGRAFGSKPGDLLWCPIADANNDLTINYIDAIVLGTNFGQSWT